jgi:hypothetical protein
VASVAKFVCSKLHNYTPPLKPTRARRRDSLRRTRAGGEIRAAIGNWPPSGSSSIVPAPEFCRSLYGPTSASPTSVLGRDASARIGASFGFDCRPTSSSAFPALAARGREALRGNWRSVDCCSVLGGWVPGILCCPALMSEPSVGKPPTDSSLAYCIPEAFAVV